MLQNYIKYNAETPPKYPQTFTGKTYSPLLCYRFVSTTLAAQIPSGNAIANSQGLLHAETGFSYFGARYYDSDILTGWLSVDPMADKYPGLSPYAYCAWTRPTGADEHRLIEFNIANNPVRLVDPDGEDIEIVDNDGKKYTWTISGKIYYRNLCINDRYQSQNVKNKLNMLNKIYATSAGKKVLQELVSSKETYSITNELPTNKNATASYDGGENKFKMGKSNDISVFAHELFHAYQDQKGRNNPSIYNEVEAYVFQEKIMDQLEIDSKFNSGVSSSNNSKYEKSMNNLVKKFSVQDFNYAISNFRISANANKNGDYKDYKYVPSGFNLSNSLLIGL